MSNYVTNHLKRTTSTLTQVDMCRYKFQSNYCVVVTNDNIQLDIAMTQHGSLCGLERNSYKLTQNEGTFRSYRVVL